MYHAKHHSAKCREVTNDDTMRLDSVVQTGVIQQHSKSDLEVRIQRKEKDPQC